MAEISKTMGTRVYQGLLIASCALGGGIAGGIALDNKHDNMADRVEHCIDSEPGSTSVSRETQLCLDARSYDDLTLIGSPVAQEFAIGTPFSELVTASQQYRENDIDEGVLLGMATGSGVAITWLLGGYVKGRQRRTSEKKEASQNRASDATNDIDMSRRAVQPPTRSPRPPLPPLPNSSGATRVSPVGFADHDSNDY